MPNRLKEEIESALKRFDHKQASELHVLYGILRITTEDNIPNRLVYLDQVSESLRRIKNLESQDTAKLTERASFWLERVKNDHDSKQIFRDLAAECGIIVEEEAAPSHNSAGTGFAVQTSESSGVVKSDVKYKDLSDLTVEETLSELNSLIGLDSVKKQISSLVSTHKVNKARIEKGLPPIPQSLHLVFSGDPGTGKTTVARLVSQIYKSLEVLPNGHLVEASRADLVAGFVGQTALKVTEVAEKAFGGVLFIDEAYSLSLDAGAGFGSEAISTLLQHMENNRGKLAVIAAGYTEQMKDFVVSNPGLRSRFQTFIDFPNYSPDELFEIFKKFAADYHLIITPEVEQKLREHFSKGNFGGETGNARYVRSLFEKMFANLAHRANEDGHIEDHEIEEFTVEDIPDEPIRGMSTGNKIGFN